MSEKKENYEIKIEDVGMIVSKEIGDEIVKLKKELKREGIEKEIKVLEDKLYRLKIDLKGIND